MTIPELKLTQQVVLRGWYSKLYINLLITQVFWGLSQYVKRDIFHIGMYYRVILVSFIGNSIRPVSKLQVTGNTMNIFHHNLWVKGNKKGAGKWAGEKMGNYNTKIEIISILLIYQCMSCSIFVKQIKIWEYKFSDAKQEEMSWLKVKPSRILHLKNKHIKTLYTRNSV